MSHHPKIITSGPSTASSSPPSRVPRAQTGPQHASSTDAQSPPRTRTVRISRIPKAVGESALREWLEGLEQSNGKTTSSNLIQLSVARSCAEFSQATATFHALPAYFNNVCEGTQTVEGPEKSRLTLDIHFHGCTVLYEHSKPSILFCLYQLNAANIRRKYSCA